MQSSFAMTFEAEAVTLKTTMQAVRQLDGSLRFIYLDGGKRQKSVVSCTRRKALYEANMIDNRVTMHTSLLSFAHEISTA